MEPLYVAFALVVAVALMLGGAYYAGWSSRDRSAEAERALVSQHLGMALDAIESLKADAAKASVASAGMVEAARRIGAARAALAPRDRIGGLLRAGDDPGDLAGPAPAARAPAESESRGA